LTLPDFRPPFIRGSELYPDEPLDGYAFLAAAGVLSAWQPPQPSTPLLQANDDGPGVTARDFLGSVALLVNLGAGHCCFVLQSSSSFSVCVEIDCCGCTLLLNHSSGGN
jgi:hypothetical protein